MQSTYCPLLLLKLLDLGFKSLIFREQLSLLIAELGLETLGLSLETLNLPLKMCLDSRHLRGCGLSSSLVANLGCERFACDLVDRSESIGSVSSSEVL
jgi:hypothetical protein